jgi:dynein heavy chain, axonemal
MEALVENFDPSTLHPDFRLWLTAMPSPQFPVVVLQNAVKMTLEPPRGLKANMIGSYQDFSDSFFEECKQVLAFKKLIFSLCWFHAIMQERRKFGPLGTFVNHDSNNPRRPHFTDDVDFSGWNIAYDFSNSDRDCDCCIKQLRVFLNKYEVVPYKVVVQLSGDVNYGGRITDDWDRRTMNTLLAEYVCPEAMNEGYQFSNDQNYRQLGEGKYSDIMDALKIWPVQPHPEAFGLHENADITCAQNEVRFLFESILSLQPRVSTGGGQSREAMIDEISARMLESVPTPWLLLDIQKKYPVKYEDSMNTALQQECI